MKKILSLLLLLALFCAGCAEESPAETTSAPTENPIVCYILYAAGYEDDLMEADILEDYLYRMGYGYDEMFVEFHGDGTGTINLLGTEGQIGYDDTAFWSVDAPDVRTEYTLEDNRMTIDNDGFLWILEN